MQVMQATKNFEIIVDSTSDLDEYFRQTYDIRLLYSHFTVDGQEENACVDWSRITREEFYAALKADPDRFKTAPPSVGEMALCMEDIVTAGMGVLYLTISGSLSGTYEFAVKARAMVLDKYPDAKIVVVDTRRFGPAIGLMAVNASLLRAGGRTLEETAAIIEADKNRYHQAGWLDDLSYVAKTGRLTNAKAFFGTLIGIKPIGEFDYNGLTTVLGKAKGEKAALDVLLAYVKATITDPENQIIFIAQSNRLKQAEKYKVMIEEALHPKAVYVKDVYCACGINVGPGLMAAYYIGKEISSDLSVEKNILKDLIGG